MKRSFIEWVALRERREMELYHGTTTGADDEKLRAFRDKGIVPCSATGHGQGAGYYTFTDKAATAQHAMGLAPKADQPPSVITGDDIVSGSRHGGNPMAVVHKARLNPRDYEYDHEVHSEYGLKFIISNLDQINSLLKNKPAQSEEGFKVHSIYFDKGDGKLFFWMVDPDDPGFDVSKARAWYDYTWYDTNILNGDYKQAEEIGQLLQALRRDHPELDLQYKKFVRSIQKHDSKQPSLNKAIKYVGDQPITPDRIAVHHGGKWGSANQYLASKQPIGESDDPVAAWKALRASAGWNSDTSAPATGSQKPVSVEPVQTPAAAPRASSKIPAQIVDLLQSGFRSGGPVPDTLVRFLGLARQNYSFVADSLLHVRGHAYPFYKEKRAGQPTGRFMFVQGFPIDRLLRELDG